MKKITAIILLVLAMLLLTSCKSNTENGTSESLDKNYNITVYNVDGTTTEYEVNEWNEYDDGITFTTTDDDTYYTSLDVFIKYN